jgi:hypothetical protein
MVKPDVVTLSTVPIAPPAAAADLALSPSPPAGPGRSAVDEGAVLVAAGDEVEQPATSPVAASIAPTAIH